MDRTVTKEPWLKVGIEKRKSFNWMGRAWGLSVLTVAQTVGKQDRTR